MSYCNSIYLLWVMFDKTLFTWFALVNADLPRLAMVLCFYLLFSIFELYFSAEKGQSVFGRVKNILFASIYIIGGLFIVGIIYAVIPWQARIQPSANIFQSIVISFLYIFTFDFFFYWYHRIQHTLSIFWPIHELHHADEELNVTTSMRTYWLDLPLQTLFLHLPVSYIVGIDTSATILLPFFITFWLLFTHANLRLQMGILTPVFCGPQLHRIHHSNLEQHRDKNFAQFFPIFDIIFGTYYRPASDEFPTTGTTHLASDASISHVMLKPLRDWWRLISRNSSNT